MTVYISIQYVFVAPPPPLGGVDGVLREGRTWDPGEYSYDAKYHFAPLRQLDDIITSMENGAR